MAASPPSPSVVYNPRMHDRTPGNRGWPPLTLVLFTAALALPASRLLVAADGDGWIDTVDVEVRERDTVVGTLRPAEERETFQISLPRGAKLKATAKPLGPDAPATIIEITDPMGALLGTSAAAKSSSKTPRVTVADSGSHKLRIRGDGLLDGDYKLKINAKMPKSASESSAVDLAPGAEATFTFGAAGGSNATVTVSAPRGSALRPTILEITGPDEFAAAVGAPDTASKKHVLRGVALPVTGDYTVRFRNDGDATGPWTGKASLRVAKAPKLTIEITDDVLAGEFAGEQAVYARNVGAEGGIVAPIGDDLDILGVSVEVPAGAVTEPTLFTIAETDTFFVDDDLFEGGTTFELGPAGIRFESDVTVTVPFDAQAYDDPGSEVQVAIRDRDTGEVEIVTGIVDVDAGTISFQTPHFSGFQPVSPRPRPLRGGFVEVEIGGGLTPQFGGGFLLGANVLLGRDGPRTGNVVTRSRDRYLIGFGPDQKGDVTLSSDHDQTLENGIAQAEGELLLSFGKDVISYLRGRTPDAMIRSEAGAGGARISALLRRVKGKPTQGALRGDWHAVVLEFSAARASASAVGLATAGQRFELMVEPGGRAVASGSDLRVTRVAYPAGTIVKTRNRKAPKPGLLQPNGAFVRLTMDLGSAEGAEFVDLHPVARGDLLVGVTGSIVGSPGDPTKTMARLVVLARAGVNGDDELLDGRSQVVALDTGFATPAALPLPVATVELLDIDVQHDGAGRLRAQGASLVLQHDVNGAPTLVPGQVDFPGTYRVDKDLIYRESTPLGTGALLRRRGLYIATLFDEDRIALGFGMPSRPVE